MIERDVWLPQIVSYIAFVADDAAIRRAWVDRDFTETSVTDYDELFEQIFDDLDSDALEAGMLDGVSGQVRDAVHGFLHRLRVVDTVSDRYKGRPELLLETPEWGLLRSFAKDAVQVTR